MGIVRSRWKGLALSAAVVAAVAAATLGITTLLGITFSGGGSQPVAGVPPTARGPGLAICVQAVEIEAVRSPNGDEVLQAAAGDPARLSPPVLDKSAGLWTMQGASKGFPCTISVTTMRGFR